MPNDKAQKLKEIMNLLTDSLTRKDFEAAFAQVVEYVKKNGKQTEEDVKTLTQAVNSAISRIESTASENYAKTSEKLTGEAEKALNDVQFKVEALIAECQAKMDDMHDGEDGEDADEERVIKEVLKRIPPTPPVEMEVTSEDKEELEKQIEELKKQISIISSMRSIGGTPRGIQLKVNGVKQGMVAELNIVGSGVAISNVNGLPTVTFTGGSGATAVETPTGAVNGTNDTYTVAHEPLYIIVDGVSKFVTLHYTYVAGTITVIDGAVPTQYIRSVYSA